jgi:hypothetical protein
MRDKKHQSTWTGAEDVDNVMSGAEASNFQRLEMEFIDDDWRGKTTTALNSKYVQEGGRLIPSDEMENFLSLK